MDMAFNSLGAGEVLEQFDFDSFLCVQEGAQAFPSLPAPDAQPGDEQYADYTSHLTALEKQNRERQLRARLEQLQSPAHQATQTAPQPHTQNVYPELAEAPYSPAAPSYPPASHWPEPYSQACPSGST